jgi:MYXO-CTERM domain-containing protein
MTCEDLSKSENWPNDPDYAYSDQKEGQWNYYCFLPKQEKVGKLRAAETASGMSIDLAWRYSRGDDAVRIAVTDSGIEWDNADLRERIWLNADELQAHKPTKPDKSPCGGTGALAELDCNGDGIFNIVDYEGSPNVTDRNKNGVLDAGDLILEFSDGIDDGGNGYVDDIAGWDFMKNDNDPFDDTRYGHGTGEGNDSVGTGNNGVGGIGACHQCRLVPLRTGDSFIADVNAIAQAAVYAADNGIRVVQCALGSVNMNRFMQAALDYAWQKNVLFVASMADENARHHNMPTVANHTLAAHSIEYYPTASVTDVQTFIHYDTCSNYGGHNMMSVSGTGCSSEATGQLSGMAGLVFSAALKYGIAPALTPGEAQQLFIQTADDIDVPESREPESEYFWSQPGFDQRFGYGRPNANRALEWIRDGKIPPVVDLVRPDWYEVLYADQVAAPVEIHGSISAARATSYDYVVEWAPGVHPLDEHFKVLAEQANVPRETITGEDAPLALLDVRTIDPAHEPDDDSPHGENRYTITVRVRATAHYGGAVGDVPGVMRRTYYVHRDPTLLKGFPIRLEGSGEASPKLADLDGDGAREIVYVTAGGQIHALRVEATGPVEMPGFPFTAKPLDGLLPAAPGKPSFLGAPAYAGAKPAIPPEIGAESFSSTPAVGDLDGDGKLEIVAPTVNGTLYVVGHDGKVRDGWPVRLDDVPSCPIEGAPAKGLCSGCAEGQSTGGCPRDIVDRGIFSSPVLADMNEDGKLEILQAGFDGKLYVFDASGKAVDGWPVEIHYTGGLAPEPPRGRILTTPAVADFNGDGIPDVLIGSNERLAEAGNAGAMYLVDGRGTKAGAPPWLPNWPVTLTSLNLFPLVAEGVPNSPVTGVLDGERVAVFHGNVTLPIIVPADPGKQKKLSELPPKAIPDRIDRVSGEPERGLEASTRFGELSKAFIPNVMFPLFANPSLGDVDQDGALDVVTSGSSLNIAIELQGGSLAQGEVGEHLVTAWSVKSGMMLPGAPFVNEDFSFFNSHAIVDLNGDDYPEIVAGSGGYYLHAWDGCGREAAGFPKFTGQWIIETPAVGDLDGDGKLEVVVGTRSGWLYAWRTDGRADGMVQWESFHHDNRNTGDLATPLEQGDPKRRAAVALSVEQCKALMTPPPPPGTLDAGGGCDCGVAPGAPGRSRAALAALAALFALGLSRRRHWPRPARL